jgi:hypothetical protein
MKRLLVLLGIIVALGVASYYGEKWHLNHESKAKEVGPTCEERLASALRWLSAERDRADEAEDSNKTRYYCGLIEDKTGVVPVKLGLKEGDPLMFQFERKSTVRLRSCESDTALEDITKEYMSDFQFPATQPAGGSDGPKEEKKPAEPAISLGDVRHIGRWAWVDVQNEDPVVQRYVNAYKYLSKGDTCRIEPEGTVTVEKKGSGRLLLRYSAPGHPMGTPCPSGVKFYVAEKDFAELSK